MTRDVHCGTRSHISDTGGSGRMVKTFGRTWLTTVTAMAGQATDARREFEAIEWWAQDPEACMFDPYQIPRGGVGVCR